MRELLDAPALAQRLRVKTATIHAWHRRGWIPCLRASRRPVLFDLEAVEAAMRARAQRKEVRRG
jgi:predicted site-specific integrase-resolvase